MLADAPCVVLFDGLDDRSLDVAGELLWKRRPALHSFAVGSSGLIQALVRHWRAIGEISAPGATEKPGPVERLVVVSGSCSLVTETQIRRATADGFVGVRVDLSTYDDSATLNVSLSALSRGASVVLYTALGASDLTAGKGGENLGRRIGIVLRDVLVRSGVRRAIVAGGDTSTHAVRQLGIESLTFAGLTTPGAPLCRCHAPGTPLDEMELVLKGGQMGPENYFEQVRKGNG